MTKETQPKTEVETEDQSKVIKGAVIYSDGSCKQGNPGYIGWGAHGYTYKETPDIKPQIAEGNYITNEGYVPIHSKAVIGLNINGKGKVDKHSTMKLVEVTSYIDFMGSALQLATNNEAELQGFTHTLERCFEKDLNVITVFVDSQYVRNGILDWCKGWERNDWKRQDGAPIPNVEWWIRAYDVYKRILAKGVQVKVVWIKGHSDDLGNNHADWLASIGAHYSADSKLRNEFAFTEPKGYWKNEIERHPFLNFKRIYFNSSEQYNTKGHYFQADTGGADVLIGKRIPETGLSIVKLRDFDPEIEEVKKRQYEIAMETNAIIMMKLDRVFSKEVYPYLSTYGKYSLSSNRNNQYGNRNSQNNLNVNFVDKKPVTIEVNPTGLSMRALESFNLLEELLDKFLQYRENGFNLVDNNNQLNAHDITSTFYDRTEKNVKGEVQTQFTLKPEFVVGFRDMSIDIEESYNDSLIKLKVPLILGTDTLPRNSLKKLEAYKPSVYLLTWREAEHSLRYATVIDCETGVGIWSNFFADKIFFPKQSLD